MTTLQVLAAMWDGGGTVPPELAIVRALVERGHDVRVIGDVVLDAEVAAVGATHVPWTSAPQRLTRAPEHDIVKDWEVSSPITLFPRFRDRFLCGPAHLFAADVVAELERRPADVVVTSQLLLGAQIGAEAAGLPVVVLCANVYGLPGTGQPPMAMGFNAPKSPLGRARDHLAGLVMERMFDSGRGTVNAVRASYGLPPLAHTIDQLRRLPTMVLIDAAFDFPAKFPPHVRYAGAQLDDPGWSEEWVPPPGDDPLVLVSMGTTYQAQEGMLSRVATALGTLPVRGLVTTGPAVDPAAVTAPPNVHVVRSAPHNQVLVHAGAVVNHGGHGTVAKALAAGVPMLVLPISRDQPDNAARVKHHGTGLRLRPKASPAAVARAIGRLLHEPHFRANAQRLGAAIRANAGPDVAVAAIEAEATRAT